MKLLVSLATLIALVACERKAPSRSEESAERTAPAAPTRPSDEAVHTERSPAAERWTTAWERFTRSNERRREDVDYVFERTEDRAISVWARTKQVAGATKEKIADATILAAVKSGLAASPDVRAKGIDVDVQDDVVDLRGHVGSAAEAGEAVRIALEVPGVDKVVSHLSY